MATFWIVFTTGGIGPALTVHDWTLSKKFNSIVLISRSTECAYVKKKQKKTKQKNTCLLANAQCLYFWPKRAMTSLVFLFFLCAHMTLGCTCTSAVCCLQYVGMPCVSCVLCVYISAFVCLTVSFAFIFFTVGLLVCFCCHLCGLGDERERLSRSVGLCLSIRSHKIRAGVRMPSCYEWLRCVEISTYLLCGDNLWDFCYYKKKIYFPTVTMSKLLVDLFRWVHECI